MFQNFSTFECTVGSGSASVTLRGRHGGIGPAILLLHGHPQSHAMWHLVAPQLAATHSVVMMDLRGYGDSDRPAVTETSHSKRTMALDAVAVMQQLGFAQFNVLAHDRGARVAHRLALDHPQAVRKLMLLDIAPTLAMYENTSEAFARAYWHWFFLIQPAPLPERLIEANPVAYLHDVIGRRHAGLAAFAPQALAEYERCIAIPGTAQAICEDYRASAGIDLEHDRADRASGHKLTQALRVLWGVQGSVGRCFDVPALWRAAAHNFSGRSLPCGHYIAEEAPDLLLPEIFDFFKETT
jgi:haloacetate dehalogenase